MGPWLIRMSVEGEIVLRVLSCRRSGKTSGVILNFPMGNPATNPPKYGKQGKELFDVIFQREDDAQRRYRYESSRYYAPMEIQRVREPSLLEKIKAEKLIDEKSKKTVRFIFIRE